MEKRKLFNSHAIRIMLGLALLVSYFTGCKDKGIPLETTSDLLITSYISEDSTLSDFSQILELTGYQGFLNAYGTYTCFAPDNAAISKYASEKGKSSWKNFTVEELKQMISLHVVSGNFPTSSFNDGKMPNPSMAGLYLTTSVLLENNVKANATISADNLTKATFLKSNIYLGNGVLHKIDKVLVPPSLNMAELIEKMRTSGYSIFADAIVATGLNDTLSQMNGTNADTSRRWFTVMAESDDVFHNNGIADYAALQQKYSTKGNPKDPSDSLYIFMAYRILYGLDFMADFASNDSSFIGRDSYKTVVPSETQLIKRKLLTDSLLVVLERDQFFNITKSVSFDRTRSDIMATNGAFHTINGHYKITIKYATPVYWEFTEMPEVMANAGFRKPGTSVGFSATMIPGLSFTGPYASSGTLTYTCSAIDSSGNYPLIATNGDWFNMQVRTAVYTSVKFKTPELVKGIYKIWVCHRTGGSKGNDQGVIFDDTIKLPFKIYGSLKLDLAKSESQLEAEGYKTYLYPTNHSTYIGTYVGTVKLTSTKRHTMTLTAQSNNIAPRDSYFDMIHFIPVDMDQIWPKFNWKGQTVTRAMAGK